MTKIRLRTGGRRNSGDLTIRHHGGGHKRKDSHYRFQSATSTNDPSKVVSIEYDPNRSARIALVSYADGSKSTSHSCSRSTWPSDSRS